MFKWLFHYWYFVTDTPSITNKSNLWFFINNQFTKVKLSNSLSYFILIVNNLALKKLNIFYKVYTFEQVYYYVSHILIVCYFMLFFI